MDRFLEEQVESKISGYGYLSGNGLSYFELILLVATQHYSLKIKLKTDIQTETDKMSLISLLPRVQEGEYSLAV
jgi:hypothetical protein